MKKIIFTVSVALSAAVVHAGVSWCWWLEKKDVKTDVALGLATEYAAVNSIEISALYGASPVSDGIQLSVFGINDSETTCALQASWWFNRGKSPCAQVACVNTAKSATFDLGFVNVVNDAKVQIGFLNFNKKGFLPIFPFVNFNPEIFK